MPAPTCRQPAPHVINHCMLPAKVHIIIFVQISCLYPSGSARFSLCEKLRSYHLLQDLPTLLQLEISTPSSDQRPRAGGRFHLVQVDRIRKLRVAWRIFLARNPRASGTRLIRLGGVWRARRGRTRRRGMYKATSTPSRDNGQYCIMYRPARYVALRRPPLACTLVSCITLYLPANCLPACTYVQCPRRVWVLIVRRTAHHRPRSASPQRNQQ